MEPTHELDGSWLKPFQAKRRRSLLTPCVHGVRVWMGAEARTVQFVPPSWTPSKQYALRPGFPTAWGGGCRESIAYKRAKTPPRLINGASTSLLMKRGGRVCVRIARGWC